MRHVVTTCQIEELDSIQFLASLLILVDDTDIVVGRVHAELHRLRVEVFEANDLARRNVHEADAWVHHRLLLILSLLLFNLSSVIVFILRFVVTEEARVDECVSGSGPLPVLDTVDSDRFLLATFIQQDLHAG